MLNIYYFHPDHLGSSSYITNSAGTVSQHMEYLPFGETLVDEHLNSNNSPFKYNGKEFDEETGNYYYGARYYDPKWSIFISVDPLTDKYPGISPYAYCFNNPIKLIDPTGMEPDEPGDGWVDGRGKKIDPEKLKNVKAYIFYDSEFSEQASVQYGDAVKEYGEGNVAMCNVNSKENFADNWKKMDGSPLEVSILTHGKNQSINCNTDTNSQITSTGDSTTNISGMEALNVSDLGKPKADLSQAVLNMYTCHSYDKIPGAHDDQGPLKGNKQTIAEAFCWYYDFKSVKATAGSVNYHSRFTDFTPISDPEYMRPYPENGKWVYLTKPKSEK